MNYNKIIIKSEFINRPNRFYANVKVNNEIIKVHVPNTGRCREILIPGCTVYLRKEDNPTRKTPFDLIAAIKDNKLISIDSQIPNKVVDEALKDKKIPELVQYTNILREKTFGKSRFDFKLSNAEGKEYFLEVKGVTLEENGKTRFPDAPTERGTKHILELIEAKKLGYGAGVIFLIQLKEVKSFEANNITDPKFAEALKYAKESGVDIFAYNCNVGEEYIELNEKIKVIL